MPTVDLATLPSLPYVYSGTTPAAADTCQLIVVPSRTGVMLTIHNRDKISKELRLSFASGLTQNGAAPTMYMTLHDPHAIYIDGVGWSGFDGQYTMALFSDSANVNYELLFSSALR